MSWGSALFWVSGATALLGAVLAVALRNIFHNILGFALALVGVAGLFLTLGSDFLALVLILVYVGALAIAMVYAVMLSYPLDTKPQPRSTSKVVGAGVLAALVAAALYAVVLGAHFAAGGGPREATAQWVGRRLLEDYVLAFELISVLLVVAMIGAVMVARKARMPRQPLKPTPRMIG
ncbi:MAG TPA: NADH-quinone oxidoreductase subunit J [Gemmatimonadales bacterium]|nr:NADH-quinone oxidoreductase subunit J [Gemmatimonadales bacterium]